MKKLSPDNDCIKFLITTDNHLGYREKHKIVHNDSFDAFEEALQISKDEKVDFVLLG